MSDLCYKTSNNKILCVNDSKATSFQATKFALASSKNIYWILGGLPKDKDKTIEALKLIGQKGLIALKATCLLGGTLDPEGWDEESSELWNMILDAAAEHDMPIHIHTSPSGGSDIDNALAMIKKYGKCNKIHVVHMGGGVSGHIKFVPKFCDLV